MAKTKLTGAPAIAVVAPAEAPAIAVVAPAEAPKKIEMSKKDIEALANVLKVYSGAEGKKKRLLQSTFSKAVTTLTADAETKSPTSVRSKSIMKNISKMGSEKGKLYGTPKGGRQVTFGWTLVSKNKLGRMYRIPYTVTLGEGKDQKTIKSPEIEKIAVSWNKFIKLPLDKMFTKPSTEMQDLVETVAEVTNSIKRAAGAGGGTRTGEKLFNAIKDIEF